MKCVPLASILELNFVMKSNVQMNDYACAVLNIILEEVKLWVAAGAKKLGKIII